MERPHSVPCLLSDRAQIRVSEDPSPPLESSPTARKPKPFTLLLGLGIGCSIIMSGLLLQEEQHRPPLHTGGHSRTSRCRPAALAADCAPKPPTLQPVTPLALPTATPERRQLAQTEFITPPSPALAGVPPEGDEDDDGKGRSPLLEVGMPDPVLATIIRDFDHDDVDKDSSRLSSSSSSCPSRSSPPCSKRPPPAACSSGSDSVGAEGVEVAPRKRQEEHDSSQPVSISAGFSSSAPECVAAGRGKEEAGEKSESFRDDGDGDASVNGGGKASSGGGGGGDRGKAHRVALPSKGEEGDVPDGEWRRYEGGLRRIKTMRW